MLNSQLYQLTFYFSLQCINKSIIAITLYDTILVSYKTFNELTKPFLEVNWCLSI